jgi:hypothetical protein
MQAIVRGQVRSFLMAVLWATGSSRLGDEESIVKKSPKTSRPVSTPPITMIDSSFDSQRGGQFPRRLIGPVASIPFNVREANLVLDN